MHQHAIEITNLSKHYGRERIAVDNLSMSIRRGEIYGFIGPNGAGKTTVMRVLIGLIRPTRGTARILGEIAGSTEANSRVGAIIEEPGFYSHLSGRENLRVMALHAGVSTRRLDAVLEEVHLTSRADDGFATYSMGMRQRLGLAAALLKNPDVLILDEPTNGLDPEGIADMRKLLRDLSRGDRTIMLSSHLMSEVEHICDRIGVIKQGKLIHEGTVDELGGAPKLCVRAEPLDKACLLISELPCVDSVEKHDVDIVVSTPLEHARDINRLLVCNGVEVSRLSPMKASVEDMLFDLLDSERREIHE